MLLSQFMSHLDSVRQLSDLNPHSRDYRKKFKSLKSQYYLSSYCIPQLRRYEIIQTAFTLFGIAFFIFLCVLWMFDGKMSDAKLLAGILFGCNGAVVSLLTILFTAVRIHCIKRNHFRERITTLGKRLNMLTPDQYERVNRLCRNSPGFQWGEDVQPGDICGCFNCIRTFPAVKYDPYEEQYLSCPYCDTETEFVCGSSDVPVNEEILQILHDLFIEEK